MAKKIAFTLMENRNILKTNARLQHRDVRPGLSSHGLHAAALRLTTRDGEVGTASQPQEVCPLDGSVAYKTPTGRSS